MDPNANQNNCKCKCGVVIKFDNIKETLLKLKQLIEEQEKDKQIKYEKANPQCSVCYVRHPREEFLQFPCKHIFCFTSIK